jgi:hypothetical protein
MEMRLGGGVTLYIPINWCKLPFPLFMDRREATVLAVYYSQIDLSSGYI